MFSFAYMSRGRGKGGREVDSYVCLGAGRGKEEEDMRMNHVAN